MKRLLIIGAGSLAQEIYSWIDQAIEIQWDSIGFLQDDPYPNRVLPGEGIIGDYTGYIPQSHDVFICGIADPKLKLKICEDLKSRGAIFINVIHKTAVIAADCVLGEGVVAYPFTYIGTKAVIENFVQLNVFVSIGHNAVVGAYSTLSPHCDVTGYVVLGKGVFMGTHASIIPKLKIGNFALLGAGSVVLRHVPEKVTVIGNPAKILSYHTEVET